MQKQLFAFSKTTLGELIVGIAFGKLSKLLPVKRVLETDQVLAFWHPKPYWEQHILIVPKRTIKNLASATPEDLPYIQAVFAAAQEIVVNEGWDKTDFSITTNGGARQEVAQLHFHLMRGPIVKDKTE